MARYRKQPIDIPLVQGLSQGVDGRMQAAGGLEVAENVYFEKDARLVKRPGFPVVEKLDQFGDTTPLNLKRAYNYQGRVLYIDERTLWDEADGIGLIDRGPYPNFAAPERTVNYHDVASGVAYCAMVEVNGYRVHAWVTEDSPASGVGELWTSISSLDGTLLFRERIVSSNGTKPRLCVAGNRAVLWYVSFAADDLYVVQIDTTTVPTAWGTPINVAAMSSDHMYDATALGEYSYVSFYDGTDIWTIRLDASLGATHSDQTTDDASQGIGICIDSSDAQLAVAFSDAATTSYMVFAASNLGATLPGTTILSDPSTVVSLAPLTAATEWAFILGQTETVAAIGTNFWKSRSGTVDAAGTSLPFATEFWHVVPGARPWMYGSRLYCVMLLPSNATELQSAYYICEVPYVTATEDLRPVCSLAANGTAQYIPNGLYQATLNEVTQTASGEWAVSLPEFFQFKNGGVLTTGGIAYAFGTAGVTTWDFSAVSSTRMLSAELGSALFFSGGVVSQYDGDVVAEVGFAYPPHKAWSKYTKTAGALTYIYTATYIWQDRLGMLHESPPGLPTTITSAALPVEVRVMTQTLTAKHQPSATRGTPVGIRIYRTTAGGTIFYWVADIPNETGSSFVGPYTDSRTDNDIASGFTLYTDGGALPHAQLMSASSVAAWDNRLFASQDDGIAHTKQWTADRAVSFVADPSHTIDTRDADDVTGMATLDDALVIGKRSALYVVGGSGPTPLGINPYAPARQLSTDSGVLDARSLLLGAQGLYFQGQGGIYLIPRGLGAPVWLGKAARDVFDDYPEVMGCALDTRRDLAYWACWGDELGQGVLLVFDTERGAWSTWDLGSGAKLEGVIVTPSGQVRCPTPRIGSTARSYEESGYSDGATTHVQALIQTQHISPSNKVNGYSRGYSVRVRGELLDTECQLNVEARVDDSATFDYGTSWIIQGAIGDQFEREWVLPWPNFEVITLRFYDTAFRRMLSDLIPPPLQPLRGVALKAITLDVAVRGGAQKPLQKEYRG